LRFLVFGTPCANRVPYMRTLIEHLRIITHAKNVVNVITKRQEIANIIILEMLSSVRRIRAVVVKCFALQCLRVKKRVWYKYRERYEIYEWCQWLALVLRMSNKSKIIGRL
jgi:hypothetical protein